MTNDLQHVYLPKLFGGPCHGKRMAFSNPLAHMQYVTRLPNSRRYYMPEPAETLSLVSEQAVYLRHAFQFGRRRVHAFVISTKSGEEAFEMVYNYVLRDAIKC